MNKHLTSQNDPELRLLVAYNEHTDVADITSEIRKSTIPWKILSTMRKETFIDMVKEAEVRVIVVDYDFGVFPFLNEARKAIEEVPCIILSELELPQNALKCGLNICILKQEISRLGCWLDLLTAAGVVVSAKTDIGKQIELFERATRAIPPSGVATALSHASGRQTDALKQWTAELEQKMRSLELPPKSNSGIEPAILP